jgi:hypothetical protein
MPKLKTLSGREIAKMNYQFPELSNHLLKFSGIKHLKFKALKRKAENYNCIKPNNR